MCENVRVAESWIAMISHKLNDPSEVPPAPWAACGHPLSSGEADPASLFGSGVSLSYWVTI